MNTERISPSFRRTGYSGYRVHWYKLSPAGHSVLMTSITRRGAGRRPVWLMYTRPPLLRGRPGVYGDNQVAPPQRQSLPIIKRTMSCHYIDNTDRLVLRSTWTVHSGKKQLESPRFSGIYSFIYFALGIVKRNLLWRRPSVCGRACACVCPSLHSYITARTRV